MSGSLEPDVRASHDDREMAVERLRVAAGDGRLGAADLDERIERALTASTRGQLRAVLHDLPAPVEDELALQARRGNVERTGAWTVPRRLRVDLKTGNAVIDLTHATVVHSELDVDVAVVNGNLRVIAPPDVDVEVGSVSVQSGNVRRRRRGRAEGVPTRLRVRVEGEVKRGNVIVTAPRRRLRDLLRRRR